MSNNNFTPHQLNASFSLSLREGAARVLCLSRIIAESDFKLCSRHFSALFGWSLKPCGGLNLVHQILDVSTPPPLLSIVDTRQYIKLCLIFETDAK